jgi:hypothetical protein
LVFLTDDMSRMITSLGLVVNLGMSSLRGCCDSLQPVPWIGLSG